MTPKSELRNYPADLPPGFKFEPLHRVCPRCGWDLRQQPEKAERDEPQSQEDQPVAEHARVPGVSGHDTGGVKPGSKGVIDPLAKADEKPAERDERRGCGRERGQQASAAQQKDPKANNDKHLIPVFKPQRPIQTQRRDWQALIGAAKERAEQWLRDHRALEEDSDAIRAALKAAYVSGFLFGAQQGLPARVAKHPFGHDGQETQYESGG